MKRPNDKRSKINKLKLSRTRQTQTNARGSDRDINARKKLEQSLRESEQKFAKVFQNNAAAITLARLRDGMILDVNQKWEEIFGRRRREVVGKTTARDFFIWADPKERVRIYKDLKAGKAIQNRECELLRKNGTKWTGLVSAEVIQLQDEEVIISSLMDITERKRMEEENRSLAKFPSENPNPVMRFTPAGTVLYANAASSSLFRAGKSKRIYSVPGFLLRVIHETFAANSPRTIDLEVGQRVFTFDILPLVESGYINVYGRDETEHRRDEQALRSSEMRYRSLFDKMSEGFALHEVIFDKKGIPVDSRFLEVNAAFEEISGQKREAVVGRRFTELLPKDVHRFIKVLAEVARTGKPIHFKDYLTTLNKHYDVTAFAPAPGQFAVLFTDISEEQKRQWELHKLNRTLKALSDSSQAMMQATAEEEFLAETCRIIVADCGHKMAWIGYKENDKEKSIRPVAHAGFENGYLENLRLTWANTERGRGPSGTAIRTGKPVICPNMLRDPRFALWREAARKRGYFSSIALPLLANGRAFGAIAIYSEALDPFSLAEVELLSELARRLAFGIQALRLRREHSKAEEMLQNSLEILRIAQSAAKAGMWSWNIVSGELIWSPEFFELFGIDPAAGASFANWLAAVHPEDRDRAMAQTLQAVEQRIPLSNEYRLMLPGREIRWIHAAGNTNYDKSGKPLRMSGICFDNSERKLTEKQVEDSLHEKETLLRELYHRTKNNMNIISSLVALQSAAVSDLNVQRMFADMQSRIRTMSLVHEKLYQSQDLSNLDMREYIGDLARTILAGYKNSAARIALDLDVESVAFSIDSAIPCGLVINELLTNSLKYAFPEEMIGRIGISLRMSPGEEATLCYKDNGIGFPCGFDPLKATSLGLKLVQILVKKQLLGTLEFIAVQGMRAVITFKKPLARKPVQA